MRGRTHSRREILRLAGVGGRRILPLALAVLALLPGQSAFAAQPDSEPSLLLRDVLTVQSAHAPEPRFQRPCILRCNQPEKPPLSQRVREGAQRARNAVREAVGEAKEEVREAVGDAREAVTDARAEAREAAREADEQRAENENQASSQATEPAHAQERQPPAQSNQPTADEDAPPATEIAEQPAQPAPEVPNQPPAQAATAPVVPAAPAASAAPPVAAASPSAPAVAAAQAGTAAPSSLGPGDGVAGGPTGAGQRPEPGVLGAGKGPDPAAPAPTAPVVSEAAPGAESAAPDTSAPPAGDPSAAPGASAPPVETATGMAPGAPSTGTPAESVPSAEDAGDEPKANGPLIVLPAELEDWSLPLAIAGGLLACIALVIPMARRRHADDGHVIVGDRRASLSVGSGSAPLDPRNRSHTGSGTGHTIGSSGTRAGQPSDPVTSVTRNGGPHPAGTSPQARLNGSPVPYLTLVPDSTGPGATGGAASSGHRRVVSTSVEGLDWPNSDAVGSVRRQA